MMALICAAGHAIVGRSMFYQPIKSDCEANFSPECSPACGTSLRSILRRRQLPWSRSAPVVAAMRCLARRGPVCWLRRDLSRHIVASQRSLGALSVDTFCCDRDCHRIRRYRHPLTPFVRKLLHLIRRGIVWSQPSPTFPIRREN